MEIWSAPSVLKWKLSKYYNQHTQSNQHPFPRLYCSRGFLWQLVWTNVLYLSIHLLEFTTTIANNNTTKCMEATCVLYIEVVVTETRDWRRIENVARCVLSQHENRSFNDGCWCLLLFFIVIMVSNCPHSSIIRFVIALYVRSSSHLPVNHQNCEYNTRERYLYASTYD